MDQKNISLKEEADRLMKIKGNVRGAMFRTHVEYIRHREGKKGIAEVEKKLAELGYPLRFKEIDPLGWYPQALSSLAVLVVKEIFDWQDSDIFDMGNQAPKYSLVAKLLMKYFLSVRKSFEESARYWRKHSDVGELEPYQFNEKEKYIILRVRGFKFHPLICKYYIAGYILRFTQYVLKSKKITIEETKCVFEGDPYDEYTIRWE